METREPRYLEEINLEDWRLPPELIGEAWLGADPLQQQLPPRHELGQPFIAGPITFIWIATAARLPGSGLQVAMTVRFLGRRYDRPFRRSVAEIGWRAGLREITARRALQEAEQAGLISHTAGPGRKPTWRIHELPQPSEPHWPLWGPIPWRWWAVASRLPGQAAHVGLACWVRAGWYRAATFPLPTAWPELGLRERATRRGLETLAGAGLIELDRRRGRAPFVTLQDDP